jgi:hypothetical protein
MSTATVLCTVDDAKKNIRFQFSDGSSSEIPLITVARCEVLQNALDAANTRGEISFQLAERADSLKAWLVATNNHDDRERTADETVQHLQVLSKRIGSSYQVSLTALSH